MIQSASDIHIDTHQSNLVNQHTLSESSDKGILTLGNLTVKSQHIQNNGGYLVGRLRTDVTSSDIANQAVIGKDTSRLIFSNALTQYEGQMGNLTFVGQVLNSTASLIKAHQAHIQMANALDFRDSRLDVDGNISLTASSLNNQNSTISSQTGQIYIDTRHQTLNNQHGTISAATNISIDSGELKNQSGKIQSKGTIALTRATMLRSAPFIIF